MERRIQIKSTIYTAIVCFLIFLMMLIYRVTINVEESVKFTEVIFVPPIEEQIQKLTIGVKVSGSDKDALMPVRTINLPKINLPTRFTITEEEVLPLRYAEKVDIVERPGELIGVNLGSDKSEVGQGFKDEIRPGVGISGIKKGEIEQTSSEFLGSGIVPKFSYRIEWEGKINRIKISGELPRFPEGIRESVVVKFRIIVRPDGTVERIFPLEKANPEFERAVFEVLGSWRFNPINENVKQAGVITFNFKLE